MRILLLMLLTGIVEIASAQYSVTGTVTDQEDNTPVAGVNVRIPVLEKFTTTDASGMFVLEGLSEGSYSVLITHISYQPYRETVEVKGKTELKVQLTPSTLVADEVIVSSTRATEKTRLPDHFFPFPLPLLPWLALFPLFLAFPLRA